MNITWLNLNEKIRKRIEAANYKDLKNKTDYIVAHAGFMMFLEREGITVKCELVDNCTVTLRGYYFGDHLVFKTSDCVHSGIGLACGQYSENCVGECGTYDRHAYIPGKWEECLDRAYKAAVAFHSALDQNRQELTNKEEINKTDKLQELWGVGPLHGFKFACEIEEERKAAEEMEKEDGNA